MKKRLIVVAIALLLSASSGCAIWKEDSSKQPDEVLFMRAKDAFEKQKFDVVRLSLETLLNTYPDSEYVPRAKELLYDPQMPRFKGDWIVGGSSDFDETICRNLKVASATP
jgi:hypothetical protein